MARTTKILGVSLPPDVYNSFDKLAKATHKTRSELFRSIVESYSKGGASEQDMANLLKAYWNLRSKSELNIITIGLAIIVNKDNKVLIGARKAKDKWVENLTWVFPGGNLESLEFDKELKKEVYQETGLRVNVNSLIASRIHPDSGFKNVQIVALFFYCTPTGTFKLKAGGDLAKLKWVKPTDVFKDFTTSTSDEVTKFLLTIEKSS